MHPSLQELDYQNICNTDAVKAGFKEGGWDRAYFGRALWDTRGVAMVAATLFPATSAVAAQELLSELRAQYQSAMLMLEKAAKDAVRKPMSLVTREGALLARTCAQPSS
jgi:hypothetical protein